MGQETVQDVEKEERRFRKDQHRLRSLLFLLAHLVYDRRVPVAAAHKAVRALIRQYAPEVLAKITASQKRDLAEGRRAWFEDWYRKLGFTVTVPKPPVSNREFARREKAGEALFYRPATCEISYKTFMAAVGQISDWTVMTSDSAKIDWDPANKGYWFWAEIQKNSRLTMSWNQLSKQIRLLSLEEYVIVWHAHKANGTTLDVNTWCWLKTRFGAGAICICVCDGTFKVNWYDSDDLCSYSRGGRRSEVVTAAEPAATA